MIISEIELFKGIDFEVMNKIAKICSEESYSKGIVLFRNNEKAESLYIIIEGTVYLEVKNGGTITYSLNDPGEVFGWSSMFESGRYTATGICATDLKVVKIERNRINKIFSIHPDAGIKILRRLGTVFSNRLSNAYRDLLSARSSVSGPAIWMNENIISNAPEEPFFDVPDNWHAQV
ncbi:MAG: cyclic nucleotide-binding domain-containing protein [Desulfobacteraceae bacterium]|nr:cyclic nucleotide-binding domain-containing protein [Desulfobacteraceae bacterium]MBC2754696.1 cyclic nucleotide-binding domain-containing protein [Desulfobacteraceae bacterium]